MKSIVVAFLLVSVLFPAHATQVVIDPALIGTTQTNWLAELAKQAKQLETEIQTQIDTHTAMLKDVQQVENSTLQLLRMGDTTLMFKLPGISNIITAGEIVQQTEADVNHLASFANPQNATITANQILQMYGQPVWNGFTSSNGTHIGPNGGMIQFEAANYNVDNSTQVTLTALRQKLQTAMQDKATAVNALQSATDENAREKEKGIIAALDGTIAQIHKQMDQAVQAGAIQKSQNNAAAAIYQATNAQQQQAADLQAIDQGFTGVPMGNFRQPTYWGDVTP